MLPKPPAARILDPPWGYAVTDEQPFNEPSSGALLGDAQVLPRGHIEGDRPGRVFATVSNDFQVTRRRTRVVRLRVRDAPPGATVTVLCDGRRCGFARRTVAADAPCACRRARPKPSAAGVRAVTDRSIAPVGEPMALLDVRSGG